MKYSLLVKLIYNIKISKIIEVLLFFANFRINSNLFLKLSEDSKVKLVIVIFKSVKEILNEIKN